MDAALAATLGIVALLVVIHVAVSYGNGFALPESTRDRFGGSADTTFSRLYAQFTAPFFHYGWGHLAYNGLILLATMPIALRALGVGRGLGLLYLAGPTSAILVNVLIILPLVALGLPYAISAAPVRLVGFSVIMFAGVAVALVAILASRGLNPSWAFAGLALFASYEGALTFFGATQPFVWAYHTAGFVTGLVIARVLL